MTCQLQCVNYSFRSLLSEKKNPTRNLECSLAGTNKFVRSTWPSLVFSFPWTDYAMLRFWTTLSTDWPVQRSERRLTVRGVDGPVLVVVKVRVATFAFPGEKRVGQDHACGKKKITMNCQKTNKYKKKQIKYVWMRNTPIWLPRWVFLFFCTHVPFSLPSFS